MMRLLLTIFITGLFSTSVQAHVYEKVGKHPYFVEITSSHDRVLFRLCETLRPAVCTAIGRVDGYDKEFLEKRRLELRNSALIIGGIETALIAGAISAGVYLGWNYATGGILNKTVAYTSAIDSIFGIIEFTVVSFYGLMGAGSGGALGLLGGVTLVNTVEYFTDTSPVRNWNLHRTFRDKAVRGKVNVLVKDLDQYIEDLNRFFELVDNSQIQ